MIRIQKQYEYRAKSNLRLKDPTEIVAERSFYKTLSRFDDEHTYGKPLNPGTPIRALLSNFFGEVAEQITL